MPHVYILASQKRGTPYIGEAGIYIPLRYERLVLIEAAPDMLSAIAREKLLKRWHRDWKIGLIEQSNPKWRDLAIDLGFAPLRPSLRSSS